MSEESYIYGGLFGYLSEATISNLEVNYLNDSNIEDSNYVGLVVEVPFNFNSFECYVGGISGASADSTITNCKKVGSISVSFIGPTGWTYVGGISGYISGTEINSCSSLGSVMNKTISDIESRSYVGGIVGGVNRLDSTISQCYNESKVYAYADGGQDYGPFSWAGGISSSGGVIENCYNKGHIKASVGSGSSGNESAYAGGIVAGWLESQAFYCYNTGIVEATGASIRVGGILGTSSSSITASNCYYLSGCVTGGNSAGDPVSETNLKKQNTFSGWNFTKVWGIDSSINDGYPYLQIFYQLEIYTIQYDISTNGGTGTAPSSVDVEEGQSIELPSGEYKSGWTFVGWSENASATTSGILTSPYTPTNNVTLYAIFKKDISATFYQINGTSEEKSATIYNNETTGNIITPNINVGSNETAVGWSSTNSSSTAQTAQGSTLEISGGEKYYAVVSYVVTITYSGNGATSGQMNNSTGTAVKTANGNSIPNITQYANITIAPNSYNKDNYEFLGWSKNSNSETFEYESNKAYNFDSDVTLFAIWKSNFVNMKINITTNVGAIFYIYDNENNFVQQMFVDKNSDMQILNTNLLSGGTYKIVISSVYTANINQVNGATKIASNVLTFVATENGEIEFTLFGYCGNNTVII